MLRRFQQSRRKFLQSIVGSIGTLGVVGQVSGQNQEPSITLNNQATTGESITIAEVVTDESVSYRLHEGRGDTIYKRGTIEGGQRLENLTIELDTPLSESGRYYFGIFPADGGSSLDHDDAYVFVNETGEYTEGMSVQEINPSADNDFTFPYFLYVPPTEGKWSDDTPLLVHQNNSRGSDDYSYHKKNARSFLEPGRTSRELSDELGVPLLVPATPRPYDNYEANRLQAMDNEALRLEEERLKRIDLQIKRMIEHAQAKLAEEGYPVRDEVMLNGYSGSGKFAQRFSMLHPKKVISVTAGGLAGLPILPQKKAEGHTLNYYLGIADFEDLTGKEPNIEAFKEIDHLYYEGAQDTKEFIPTDDPHLPEIKETALAVYGEDKIKDRVPFARQAFEDAGVPVEYRIYEDQGHEWAPLEDLIEHHRPHLHENTESTTRAPDPTATKTGPEPTSTADPDPPTATETSTKSRTVATPETTSGEQTTNTEAAGPGVFAGLASLLSASYIASRTSRTPDE